MSDPEQVRTIDAGRDATGLRVAVVVSRYNGLVTERLLTGAVDVLVEAGARPRDVTVVRTAGAFELPSAVAAVRRRGEHDAVVALGCLIRGETIHFDLIAAEVARSLMEQSAAGDVPVTFGVVTANTLEEANERAGGKHGNKGAEAAEAAVEQACLYRALDGRDGGERGDRG